LSADSDFQPVYSDCFHIHSDRITIYSDLFTFPSHILHLLTKQTKPVHLHSPSHTPKPKTKKGKPHSPQAHLQLKSQYPGLINVQNKHQSKITIFRSRKSINPSFFSLENTRLTLSRETPTTVANSCTFRGISIL
jgi:hypothetical protein